MQFERILHEDFDEIRRLQPDDWPDIIPSLQYYIESDFCFPVKVIIDNNITGIGTSIKLQKTCWLAHIIVDPTFRNRGIGFQIVSQLINNLTSKPSDTVLLIATKLGEPVYKKAGFRMVTEYLFFKREKAWNPGPISANIIPYTDVHRSRVFELDKRITGEVREKLIADHLDTALLYITDNIVLGYYLPGLGEGLIVADIPEAGLELMKLKYATVDKAVLPSENKAGIDFLKQNGFIETSKGFRMILGNDLNWKPERIYSRIGGNFG
jgi:GNAT superfamily N-acetyltransferase